jgi:CheY-like chemotaxis protein
MRVLIVEDDAFCAQKLRETLADKGLDVDIARSLQEALKMGVEAFGAAIIDVMLPNDPAISGLSVEETRGGFMSGVALARKWLNLHPGPGMVLLSGRPVGGEAQKWAQEVGIPFVFKHEPMRSVLAALEKVGVLSDNPTPMAFIVHGHDEASLAELKDYIQNTLRWREPVILREQANCGRTIIEKFEDYGLGVDCVFALLTPDDKVASPASDDQKRRARQNVVFELGFFYGQLGRKSGRIIVLYKGPTELPSDTQGIAWISIDNGIKAAGESIRKEVENW